MILSHVRWPNVILKLWYKKVYINEKNYNLLYYLSPVSWNFYKKGGGADGSGWHACTRLHFTTC